MTPFNRRRGVRDIVSLPAKFFEGTVEIPVTVRNITSEGALIHGETCGPVGTVVSLQLAHIGHVKGTVAWTDGDYCGIQFLRTIDYRLLRTRGQGGFGQASPIDIPQPKRAV